MQLYDERYKKFNIKYALTQNISQDNPENFFGAMRAEGDLDDDHNQSIRAEIWKMMLHQILTLKKLSKAETNCNCKQKIIQNVVLQILSCTLEIDDLQYDALGNLKG